MRTKIEVPQFVAEVISTLDQSNSPLGELEVSEALRSVAQRNPTEDQSVLDGSGLRCQEALGRGFTPAFLPQPPFDKEHERLPVAVDLDRA